MSSEICGTADGGDDVRLPSCSKTKNTEEPSSSMVAGMSEGAEANSSPTILRIKRRINEDPAQALLLSYKRFKGDTENSGSLKTARISNQKEQEENEAVVSHVLRFAGTVTSNDNEKTLTKNMLLPVTFTSRLSSSYGWSRQANPWAETSKSEVLSETITQALKAAATEKPVPCKTHNFKHRVVNQQEKTRTNFHSTISANRFRLVNSKRGTASVKDIESADADENSTSEGPVEFCHIYDAVIESYKNLPKPMDRENRDPREIGATTCNGVPLIKEKIFSENDEQALEGLDFDFVYDLYFTQGGINEAFGDQSFTLAGLSEADLQLTDYRQMLEELDSEPFGFGDGEGEEDSNDEGNWRNDYPDSDPDESKMDNSYYGTGEVDELGSHIGRLEVGDSSSDDDGDYYTPSYRAYKKRVLEEMEPEYSNEVVPLSEDSD